MADELDELVAFLSDRRSQVRVAALDIVQGLTASPDGLDKLKPKQKQLVPALLRQVNEAEEISTRALNCLVNLSQDPQLAKELLASKAIGRVMDFLRESSCPQPRLLIMMLANLTILEQGCLELLGEGRTEGLNIAILLKKFVSSGINAIPGLPDPYEHVASILTNVTRYKAARALLLQPGRGLLQALVSQIQADSETRKRGAAGAIRNCCMSAEEDGTLQHILADSEVLAHMLRPINGLEPKQPDDIVRECMAECIMVLASTPAGRKALWAVNAPEIIRKGYELEEHPGVCKALEHTAEIFLAHNGEFDDDTKDNSCQQSP